MPVLDPQFAVPVTPSRDFGADGNPDWQDLAPTKLVMSLGAPRLIEGKGSRYTQSGTAFLPRGYDIQHGDRIPYDGANYTVVGKARGNQDHPITGDDFGWVQCTVTGGG